MTVKTSCGPLAKKNLIRFIDSFQDFEIEFVVFLPENMTKEMVSLELSLSTISNEMKRVGKSKLWKASILTDRIKYCYRLKKKKNVITLHKQDLNAKKCPWSYKRRDIIFRATNPYDDKVNGIVAHVEDVLQEPQYKSDVAFRELDTLQLDNSLVESHWNKAFAELMEKQESGHLCLLLLYCIQKTYASRTILNNRHHANKVRELIQPLDQETLVHFVGEIFQTYKVSHGCRCYPLHFITDMQFLQDIPSLHSLLCSEQTKSDPRYCDKSLSSLESALKFILKQNGENTLMHDLVCAMFDCIQKSNILKGLSFLKKINAIDKKIRIDKVLFNLISKSKDDQNFISFCEKEMIFFITNHDNVAWKDLEHICDSNELFKKTDKKLLLLEAVLTLRSHEKTMYFMKHVLKNIKRDESENVMAKLAVAYDMLLDTNHGNTEEAELKSSFKEYDTLACFQIGITCFQTKLLGHVSKYSLKSVLEIHADIENLNHTTIDLYCQELKKRLKTITLEAKIDLVEKYWKQLNTR